MSMQVDAEIHKEQNGTLFCLVGALEGGFGGWGVPQGCPPQKVTVSSKNNKNNTLLIEQQNLKAHMRKEVQTGMRAHTNTRTVRSSCEPFFLAILLPHLFA